MSPVGGAGLPAERAGGTGTSEDDLEGEKSARLLIPNPVSSCAVAFLEDDILSGWFAVGVVGVGSDFSFRDWDPEGLSEELSESPRAGRSTR